MSDFPHALQARPPAGGPEGYRDGARPPRLMGDMPGILLRQNSSSQGPPVSAALKGYRHAATLTSPSAPAVRRALGDGPILLPLLPVYALETLLSELEVLFSLRDIKAAWICLPRPPNGGIVQYEEQDVIKLREAFRAAREAFPNHWLGKPPMPWSSHSQGSELSMMLEGSVTGG